MRFTIFKIAISFVVDGLGKLEAAINRAHNAALYL